MCIMNTARYLASLRSSALRLLSSSAACCRCSGVSALTDDGLESTDRELSVRKTKCLQRRNEDIKIHPVCVLHTGCKTHTGCKEH